MCHAGACLLLPSPKCSLFLPSNISSRSPALPPAMADVSSDTDESNCSQNSSCLDWELLPSDRTPFHFAAQDTPAHVPEQDQEAVRLGTYASEVLQMNYFDVLPTSTGESLHQTEEMPATRPAGETPRSDVHSSIGPAEQTPQLITTDSGVNPGEVAHVQEPHQSAVQKLDWIEPSSPYRSCTLSAEEDEDGASRKSVSPTIIDELKAEVELKSEAEWRMLQGSCQADILLELCASSSPLIPAVAGSSDLNSITSLLVNECSLLDGKDHASEAWWKRQLSVLQSEGGQANTLWSIAVAAAVVGLLILGHRWQRLRIQNQKLRLELSTKEKKISQLMYQLVRLKECISCTKRIPVIRAQPTLFEHF